MNVCHAVGNWSRPAAAVLQQDRKLLLFPLISTMTMLALLLSLGAQLLAFLVHGALSGIYAAALYRFATQSGDTQGFDPQVLRSAFLPKA